ncbi:hypothetical protein ES703_124380 [subsurface metagenome]
MITKGNTITVAIEHDVKDITFKLTIPNQGRKKNGKRKATGRIKKLQKANNN